MTAIFKVWFDFGNFPGENYSALCLFKKQLLVVSILKYFIDLI